MEPNFSWEDVIKTAQEIYENYQNQPKWLLVSPKTAGWIHEWYVNHEWYDETLKMLGDIEDG